MGSNIIPGKFGRCMLLIAIMSIILMTAPLIVVIGASFSKTLVIFPPEGITFKWYAELIKKSNFIRAFWASLIFSLSASAFSTFLGLSAAMGLRYCTGKVKSIVTAIMFSPLFFPSIIVALAIYQLCYITLGYKPIWLLPLGFVLLTVPFPLRTISASLELLPLNLDEAAMSVGAKELRVVTDIILPLIKPGVFAGWLIAFVISWNDFNMSIFLAVPELYPLSIEIYNFLLYEYSPIIASMSVVTILFTIISVIIINKYFGLSAITGVKSE